MVLAAAAAMVAAVWTAMAAGKVTAIVAVLAADHLAAVVLAGTVAAVGVKGGREMLAPTS